MAPDVLEQRVEQPVDQVAEHRARRPVDALLPYVDHYVGYRYAGFEAGQHIGLPSRHLTFVISFDEPLELVVLPDGRRRPSRFDAVVSGFHTRPAIIRHDGTQHGIQLAITPAGARALFGMPAGELAAEAVPLDAIWGRSAAELLDRLDGAASWAARFDVLERTLVGVLAARPGAVLDARPEAVEAFRRLAVSGGGRDIAALAGDVGWSRRHLSSQFGAEYGVGPKQMARVMRFERSRWKLVAPDATALAAIAAECGYADQAHMAREWRALAGSSPSQWLADERLPVVSEEGAAPRSSTG